jgi:endo-1,4-beta-xylanase
LNKAEISSLFDRHAGLVAGRYRDRNRFWNVVNEPIGTESRESNWSFPGPYLKELDPEYIARRVYRARTADPATKHTTEQDDAFGRIHRQRLLRLVGQLQQTGTPVDGICLQGHLEPPAPFDPEAFLRFCEQIAQRDLEIYITELDVLDSHFPGYIAAREKLVARQLYTLLSSALQCRAVKVVAIWHLADYHSHPYRQSVKENSNANRRPRPLLFDQQQRRKPAWLAVAQAIAEMPPGR